MSALFSECGRYRYRLDRTIGEGPPVAFLLHNPSTAGASTEDRTSRRGIGFARSLGFGHLTFINVWARVATKPGDLWAVDSPVGPSNDDHIACVVEHVRRAGGCVVGAWGRIQPPAGKRAQATTRLNAVLQIVRREGAPVFALQVNLDGSPKHPLYVPKSAELSVWE